MKTDQYLPVKCRSIFAPYIAEYVVLKRTFGFSFNPETEVLNMFDKYCVDHNVVASVLSSELLETWEIKRENENSTTHQLRIRVVRGLSKYLHQKGFDSPHVFHPLPDINKDFVPHIFSKSDINNFMTGVDIVTREPKAVCPVRHLVMPVLFRTVYGCGLRINEALHMKKEDVDFANKAIRIMNAKGALDRIVIMSDSLSEICYSYNTKSEIQNYESDYFFPAPDHGFYSHRAVYSVFREALSYAGIPYRGRSKGPRIHDLRHSFAVHVLSNWQQQGKDIYVCLPILSDYLGHKTIYSTEKYLQLVPESYSQVTEPFQKRFPNIFPEV